jgi:hypothetical protein
LWKQSICEFNTEKEHFQQPKDLSTTHKVRKSEHFHRHGEISRVTKVFTNDSTCLNQKCTFSPTTTLQ